MREKERALVSSALGSIALLLVCMAALHLLGPTPLWVPTRWRSEEFNPPYIPWVLASIPAGSLLGCILGIRKNERALAWWDYPIAWFAGSFVGSVACFWAVTLSAMLNPLLMCAFGESVVGFVFWLLNRKPKTLAEEIRSSRVN